MGEAATVHCVVWRSDVVAAVCRSRPSAKAGKGYRAGLLFGGATGTPVIEPFRQALRELGWVEGQNIVIDYRFAEYRYDRLPDLAAELVRLGVDVIVSPATPASVAAKNATGTIPIVMVGVGDPVGAGLIESFAHPGRNVTGLTFSGAGMEIYAKQLELLAEAVPQARRVAILSNPANPNHEVWMAEVRRAGRSLGVQLQFLEARDPTEFDGTFATMAKEHAAALLIVSDPVFLVHRVRLAETQPGAACRRSAIESWWRPAVSCRMGRACPISRGARPASRQDPQGCQTRRSGRRAADEGRAGHQSQDREGARPHRATHSARPRR